MKPEGPPDNRYRTTIVRFGSFGVGAFGLAAAFNVLFPGNALADDAGSHNAGNTTGTAIETVQADPATEGTDSSTATGHSNSQYQRGGAGNSQPQPPQKGATSNAPTSQSSQAPSHGRSPVAIDPPVFRLPSHDQPPEPHPIPVASSVVSKADTSANTGNPAPAGQPSYAKPTKHNQEDQKPHNDSSSPAGSSPSTKPPKEHTPPSPSAPTTSAPPVSSSPSATETTPSSPASSSSAPETHPKDNDKHQGDNSHPSHSSSHRPPTPPVVDTGPFQLPHSSDNSSPPSQPSVPASTVPQVPNPAPSTGVEKVGDTVYYNQHDTPWAHTRYDGGSGKGDIDQNGCGVTSLAEVISTQSDQQVTPIDMAKEVMADHLVTFDGSTYWKAMTVIPEAHGLKAEAIPVNDAALDSALQNGAEVISNGTDRDPATPATSAGHFFVVRGKAPDGNYLVADPNSRAKSQKEFSPNQILGPASFMAAVYPRHAPHHAPAPPTAPPTTDTKSAPHSDPAPSGHTHGKSPHYTPVDTGPFKLPHASEGDSVGYTPVNTGPFQLPHPTHDTPSSAPASAPGSATPAPPAPQPPASSTSEKDRIIQATQLLINRGGQWAVRGANMRYFLLEGYTPAHAAAIDGNFMGESGDNPASNQEGHGPGRGMGQWEVGGRFDHDSLNLVDFSASIGESWKSQDAQDRFTEKELETTQAAAFNHLHATNTPEEAALAFSNYYEMPNPKVAHNDRREAFAREDYDAYMAAYNSVR